MNNKFILQGYFKQIEKSVNELLNSQLNLKDENEIILELDKILKVGGEVLNKVKSEKMIREMNEKNKTDSDGFDSHGG